MIVFRFDGKEMDIDDLPMSEYATIEKETGISWYQFNARPMSHAGASPMLATACAKHLGVTLPVITPNLLLTLFHVIDGDNLPSEGTDGIPDPKAEAAEPATT